MPGDMPDLLKAVQLLGPGRQEFKCALEAVLVKESGDREILDKFYRLYWRGVNPLPARGVLKNPAENPPRLSLEEFSHRMSEIKDWLRKDIQENSGLFKGFGGGGIPGYSGGGRPEQGGHPSQPLVWAIQDGRRHILAGLARNAAERLAMSPGKEYDHLESLRLLKVELGWAEGEDWLLRRENTAESLGWKDNMKLLDKMLADELDRLGWLQGDQTDRREIAARSNIDIQVFDRLEAEQSEEIKKKLVRLGRRLATRTGYRRGPAPSGQVDLRRTVRGAGVTGGIPLKLYYQDRKLTRPALVLLCDLSGSVAPFSKFMLLLLNAMHAKFRQTRSFVFVEAVEEVTGFIRGGDINISVNDIYRNTSIWQAGFSDYGQVWNQFRQNHINAVNHKTTLIILGDARNNYKPDGKDHFAEIAGRAGRVIWLNPAPGDKWDSEDSIMKVYAPYCHHVFECRNLKQLERVAKKIF